MTAQLEKKVPPADAQQVYSYFPNYFDVCFSTEAFEILG
jgi:hypothetical protein